METSFSYWFSFLLLIISLVTILWCIYSSIFLPTQWNNPKGKTILITGCDSGIGLELAKHFHRKGSTVIATVLSRQSSGAQELIQTLTDRLFLVELDLSNIHVSNESILKIQSILEDNNLELNTLINNAGVLVFGEFDFYTFEQIKEQISVNFIGTTYLTKCLIPKIMQAKGRIINVSSVNTLVPFPGISIYSATKRAIECLGETLAMELKKFDVSVVCLRLGDFAKLTNIMQKHELIMKSQYEHFDDKKKLLYGDYFDTYHRSALEHFGYFSPNSFQDSSFFSDFEEAVYAINPRNYILSATFSYKLLIYFLYFIPTNLRHFLFDKFNIILNK